MRLESLKYLYDLAHAATLALEFVQGKTYSDHTSDAMLRSAVEPQVAILGEALTQLAKVDSQTASRITEYQRIIAFRNILIHGYAEIDDRIVWSVLQQYLPGLKSQADVLLTEQ